MILMMLIGCSLGKAAEEEPAATLESAVMQEERHLSM